MRYMRIPQNKFWAWVIVSMVVGLSVGLVLMFVNGASATGRIAALEARLSGAGTDASATVEAAESRAAAAEASVTALTEQVVQLKADLRVAKGTSTTGSGSSTASGTVTVTSRTVTPSSVASSGTITLTVKVRGKADKVQMRLLGITDQGFDVTYNLTKVSTSGSTQTWRRVMDSPSKKGTYRYYASAFVNGKRTTMPGTTAFTFKVR